MNYPNYPDPQDVHPDDIGLPQHRDGHGTDWAKPLGRLAIEIHRTARSKGWWDKDRSMAEVLLNIGSEVHEAWKDWVKGLEPNEIRYTYDVEPGTKRRNIEELLVDAAPGTRQAWERFQLQERLRTEQGQDFVPPRDRADLQLLVRAGILEPHGIPYELADIIIRTLDMFAALHLDADVIVRNKMEFNKTRSFRHGGKRA